MKKSGVWKAERGFQAIYCRLRNAQLSKEAKKNLQNRSSGSAALLSLQQADMKRTMLISVLHARPIKHALDVLKLQEINIGQSIYFTKKPTVLLKAGVHQTEG